MLWSGHPWHVIVTPCRYIACQSTLFVSAMPSNYPNEFRLGFWASSIYPHKNSRSFPYCDMLFQLDYINRELHMYEEIGIIILCCQRCSSKWKLYFRVATHLSQDAWTSRWASAHWGVQYHHKRVATMSPGATKEKIRHEGKVRFDELNYFSRRTVCSSSFLGHATNLIGQSFLYLRFLDLKECQEVVNLWKS